jgi:hypothetical protein
MSGLAATPAFLDFNSSKALSASGMTLSALDLVQTPGNTTPIWLNINNK